MALGTGSALAHRAVDSVLGSRHPEPAQAQVRPILHVKSTSSCHEVHIVSVDNLHTFLFGGVL